MPENMNSIEQSSLISLLEKRFLTYMERHPSMEWSNVLVSLLDHPKGLETLGRMEDTGGEPDVIDADDENGQFFWVDCSQESPVGRRSFCYDEDALNARKEHKPSDSALSHAERIGVKLLNEQEYRALQVVGDFDLKTSSWLATSPEIRKLGGAIFGDKRYNHVFIYHNGVQSYYAARGYRGGIWI